MEIQPPFSSILTSTTFILKSQDALVYNNKTSTVKQHPRLWPTFQMTLKKTLVTLIQLQPQIVSLMEPNHDSAVMVDIIYTLQLYQWDKLPVWRLKVGTIAYIVMTANQLPTISFFKLSIIRTNMVSFS